MVELALNTWFGNRPPVNTATPEQEIARVKLGRETDPNTKSTFLGAQTELGGMLVLFLYETDARGRLPLVLEPQNPSR